VGKSDFKITDDFFARNPTLLISSLEMGFNGGENLRNSFLFVFKKASQKGFKIFCFGGGF